MITLATEFMATLPEEDVEVVIQWTLKSASSSSVKTATRGLGLLIHIIDTMSQQWNGNIVRNLNR